MSHRGGELPPWDPGQRPGPQEPDGYWGQPEYPPQQPPQGYGQQPEPWGAPQQPPPGWGQPEPQGYPPAFPPGYGGHSGPQGYRGQLRQPSPPQAPAPPAGPPEAGVRPVVGGEPGSAKLGFAIIGSVLLAIAGLVTWLVTGSGSSGSSQPAAASATVSAAPVKPTASKAAPLSCRTRVEGWAGDGGSGLVTALSSGLDDFDSAVQQFADDSNAGGATASDAEGLQVAAGEIRGGAKDLADHPVPSCAKALHADTVALTADYWKGGGYANAGMVQYEDGNIGPATTDINMASTWITRGNVATGKASAALKKYEGAS